MGLLFQDELGNPAAAGIQVKLFPAGVPPTTANLIGTDWTRAGGLCPNLVATQGQDYLAFFTGRQAPAGAQAFTGDGNNPTQVVCSPYRSPYSALTTTNWASLIAGTLLPKGFAWWGDQYLQPGGGVAWATAKSMAAVMQNLGTSTQQRLQVARLQSSAGSDVDTWAYDFLGQWVPRYTGEGDISFKNRIVAALANPKTTLASLQAIVVAFYTAQLLSSGGLVAFDADVGAFDSPVGAFDLITAGGGSLPYILVWDRQSRPDLANLYNINPRNDDGSFVIQLGFALPDLDAWYLDYGFIDYDSFLVDIDAWNASTTPPDPRLGALVDFIKAGGSKPIYLTSFLATS